MELGVIVLDDGCVGRRERVARFGICGSPVPATRCFVSESVSHRGIRVSKWVLVNEVKGTVTFANTFNGRLGANWDPGVFTFKLDGKRLRKLVKLVEVPVGECPVAIPVS